MAAVVATAGLLALCGPGPAGAGGLAGARAWTGATVQPVQNGDTEHRQRARRCRTPGRADRYKLALSWQPAFCEAHAEKPECAADAPALYHARNFTLHGLWPDRRECGREVGYYARCGRQGRRRPPPHFCGYPPLPLGEETRRALEAVMPSAAAGGCLQRYQWFKHGTCQTDWSPDAYFRRAIELTRAFNESGIAAFIAGNAGRRVHEATFWEEVDRALGPGAHRRLRLVCRRGDLVEIQIALPARIDRGSLAELLARAEPDFGSSCRGRFRVDRIGRDGPSGNDG